MSSNETNSSPTHISFFDYLAVLFAWKKFIIINVIIVAVISVVIALSLPKWYKATASIMSPKEQGSTNLLGSAGSMLRGLTGMSRIGGIGRNMGDYNYVAILKSRTTMESVVRNYHLIEAYGISNNSMEKAIKQLSENCSFEMQDEDYLTVDVYDKDPKRAADVANYFVELLNQTSLQFASREARNNKEFIGKRLEEGQDSLKTVEEALKTYQEHTGMMISPEQMASISSIAQLYGMKAKKELEVGILERTVTPENEQLYLQRIQLEEINKRVAGIPQAGMETFRLYRDVAIQQKIVEFLVPLYEQAKIDEQKDIPVLLVLDYAVPPEQKSKPQRSLIILAVTFISFFIFIILVYTLHGLLNRKEHLNVLEVKLQAYAKRIAKLYRIKFEL